MKKFQAICNTCGYRGTNSSFEGIANAEKTTHENTHIGHTVEVVKTLSGNFAIGNFVSLEIKHSNLPIESIGKIISGPFIQKNETIVYVNFENDSLKFRKVPKDKLFCYGDTKSWK